MKIKLIIGIGNPGAEYAETYHNAGKMFADWAAQRASGAGGEEWKNLKLFSYIKAGTGPVIAKSGVFMNESGQAVAAAMKKFGLKPNEIAVAQDESDIELGKYKISYGSRSAGHKGIESAITALGTQDFERIRIGVRKKRGKALDFVLRKMTNSEKADLEKVFEAAWAEISERSVN